MAKQSHFKEAVQAAQEQAAVTEEGEIEAMMFALLQEQHQLQLKLMALANKATMEAMMEQMNTLVAAHGGRKPLANIENIPPLKNGSKENGKDTKAKGIGCKMTLCPHCKALVYHKPEKCYELKANKDKRWVGWKLVKETTA
jgi:hypothetical protein